MLGEVVFARRQWRRNTTDTCQNAFNKAVARVLIERLAQTNKLFAQAISYDPSVGRERVAVLR